MTRRPLAAVCVLVLAVLPSCATTSDTQVTGVPRQTTTSYDLPAVMPDYSQTPPTTAAPVVPATVAAPVPAEVEPEVVVVPAAASEPVVVGGSVEQAIARAFERFGSAVVGQALRVAQCESQMKPTARNPSSGAAGIFQLMRRYHAEAFARVTGVSFDAGWSDPYLNSLYAADLYSRQGWGPWVCQP